jgi:phospholipid transport system substrate-binding protein
MTRILSLVAALLFGAALFQPAAAQAQTADQAAKYVESLGNEAVAIIADAKLSKDQKQAKLEKIFSTNVDIAWVGRFVMGRFWRTATPEQQKRYLAEYEKFVVTHYASRFAQYSGGKFAVTGTRADAEGEYTINMKMSGDQSDEPVLVDYRVRAGKGGFKVFDVIVEGVSMITTQRSEFNAILTRDGIDGLIGKLANKSISPTAAPAAR